jgi:hypothetical protein
MDECFCGVPLSVSQRERCPSPGCPAYGKRAGTPEWEAAIRRAMARPYSNRSMDPAALSAGLEDQFPDPVEVRSRAYARARSASTTPPTLDWREAMALLGIATVGHEAGWP